jgi:ATP-binding cassette subfamily B protein
MSSVSEGEWSGVGDRSGKLGRRIVALFGPYRARVALVFVVIIVSSGLSVVGALLIKVVFDKALFPPGGPNIPLLVELVATLIAIPILTGVLNIVQTYYSHT